jgi:hypothetical protein
MTTVIFNKKWDIQNKEDYVQAVNTLQRWAFIAEMADDYDTCLREKAEISRQSKEVYWQARMRNLI